MSLLPVGLGAKGGEFNKVYMDTFQRIVLRNEPVKDRARRAGQDARHAHEGDRRAVLGSGQAEPGRLRGSVT